MHQSAQSSNNITQNFWDRGSIGELTMLTQNPLVKINGICISPLHTSAQPQEGQVFPLNSG